MLVDENKQDGMLSPKSAQRHDRDDPPKVTTWMPSCTRTQRRGQTVSEMTGFADMIYGETGTRIKDTLAPQLSVATHVRDLTRRDASTA